LKKAVEENRVYKLPMMATWLEEGGMISVTTKRRTKNASKTVTLREILSPDSGGSQ